ncbi:MAG TPA: restriction endonuclease subunit S, partial [Candidatus Ratteibacteria bacterium]|nr:restriction endonuclease subunit S [Candidatus Ratteibacteria bacterium]
RYETNKIQILSGGTGSGKSIFNKTSFEEYQLKIQDNYLLQQKIAAILSAYDDLIENNTRRIQILEEVAQMIYNEWFVKFRFPGYEKVRFVDSELGKIPEGWSVEKLDKYVDFEKGIEPGSSNYEQESNEENLPFLRVGDLNNRSAGIFINWSLAKNKIVKEDDIVISMDGTPGIVKMGLFGCYSTGIRKLIIKTNVIKKSFLYFLMLSERIQNIIKAHSKGTTILHASESIRNMNFILPDNNLMDLYDNLVSPMVKETLLLNKKNKILRQTRDLLLPKLISGELNVSDMDIKIREEIRNE